MGLCSKIMNSNYDMKKESGKKSEKSKAVDKSVTKFFSKRYSFMPFPHLYELVFFGRGRFVAKNQREKYQRTQKIYSK